MFFLLRRNSSYFDTPLTCVLMLKILLESFYLGDIVITKTSVLYGKCADLPITDLNFNILKTSLPTKRVNN